MKEFNSAVCTTIEQSQRLLEMGLKPETADMSYYKKEPCLDPYEEMECPYDNMVFPAWSLHRLMEIAEMDCFNSVATAYDEVISMIKFLHGEGYINKEYLKQ